MRVVVVGEEGEDGRRRLKDEADDKREEEEYHDVPDDVEDILPTVNFAGRLAGIVFGVKDVIAVQGLPMTGGSMLPTSALEMEEYATPRDVEAASMAHA